MFFLLSPLDSLSLNLCVLSADTKAREEERRTREVPPFTSTLVLRYLYFWYTSYGSFFFLYMLQWYSDGLMDHVFVRRVTMKPKNRADDEQVDFLFCLKSLLFIYCVGNWETMMMKCLHSLYQPLNMKMCTRQKKEVSSFPFSLSLPLWTAKQESKGAKQTANLFRRSLY